ncbi:hypothetical protein OUZ56_020100 [Daphnia magna]|uniref:Uncharacterized protein n=1 Tax=Daphnia magna TaxID=35525 RepID=A0ABQ9ZDJ4_9CRUS|nr:hypothetical protein OUZ56_020100 [Daphnia magna]
MAVGACVLITSTEEERTDQELTHKRKRIVITVRNFTCLPKIARLPSGHYQRETIFEQQLDLVYFPNSIVFLCVVLLKT